MAGGKNVDGKNIGAATGEEKRDDCGRRVAREGAGGMDTNGQYRRQLLTRRYRAEFDSRSRIS